MDDQPQFPDLSGPQRKALEELLPDELPEIITAGFKRRHFLKLIALTSTSLLATHFLAIEQLMARTPATVPAPPTGIENGVNVALTINGQAQPLLVDSRMTLLDVLRERLALTGTKKGCDQGQCGACTVLVDGRRVLACLTLAATCEDKAVMTIEGLADGDTGRDRSGMPAHDEPAASPTGRLHPLQAAFMKHDGFQCGYCTPGQICSAVALLAEAKNGEASYVTPNARRTGKSINLSNEEIQERMSGNLCRCGAYPNIVNAIREVHGQKAVAQVWQFADGTI